MESSAANATATDMETDQGQQGQQGPQGQQAQMQGTFPVFQGGMSGTGEGTSTLFPPPGFGGVLPVNRNALLEKATTARQRDRWSHYCRSRRGGTSLDASRFLEDMIHLQ